jgi:hypothetical protein
MEVFGYALWPAVELRRLHADLARETDAKRTAVAQRDAERARAESAVTVARLQARTIERLMDMRRVGFGILEPLGDVNDTPTTIDEADREAVQADPDLEADEL